MLDILRLGAYQLLEMGSVPRVRRGLAVGGAGAGGWARRGRRGLVNGVLQSIVRGGAMRSELPGPGGGAARAT